MIRAFLHRLFGFFLMPLLNERGELGDDLDPDMLDPTDGDPAPDTGQPGDPPDGNPDPDDDISDPAPDTGQPGDGTGGVQYYTPDELRELDPEKIDRNRVHPDHMPYYKAFQAGGSRKINTLQAEIAELRSKLPSDGPTDAGHRQPRDIYEAYQMDPHTVMGQVDKEYATALEKGDVLEAQKIQNLKTSLIQFGQHLTEKRTRDNALVSEHNTRLRREISDFDARLKPLSDFAQEMGVSMKSILAVTDPLHVGPDVAFEVTLALNKFYDMFKAGKTVQGKQNRTPTGVLQPRGGEAPASKERLDALHKKAMSTGSEEDWTNYLAEKRRMAKPGG